jgi:hypothetical protein
MVEIKAMVEVGGVVADVVGDDDIPRQLGRQLPERLVLLRACRTCSLVRAGESSVLELSVVLSTIRRDSVEQPFPMRVD